MYNPKLVLVELWPKIHAICPEIKFQLVPFENTRKNAREILKNPGQDIDVIAGIFDDTMLNLRNCAGFETSRQPLCCAVSVHHRLAVKNKRELSHSLIKNRLERQLLSLHEYFIT